MIAWIRASFLLMAAFALGGCVVDGVPTSGDGEGIARTIPMAKDGVVVIDLDRGSVEVGSQPTADVRIDARVSGFDAGRYRFEVESERDRVALIGREGAGLGVPGWFGGRLRVEAVVQVPPRSAVEVRTAHGKVRISGLGGDVRVESSHARVTVTDIGGNVTLATRHGRIQVEAVTGNVEVDAAHAPLSIADVDGWVRAQNAHGRVDLRDVGGEVRVRTSHSPVEISRAESVDVENSHGSIRVREVVGPLFARNAHGSIEASFSERPWGEIRTRHSRIEIELPRGEGADLSARATHGRIEVDGEVVIDGSFEPNGIEGSINGGGRPLRVVNDHGRIDLAAR